MLSLGGFAQLFEADAGLHLDGQNLSCHREADTQKGLTASVCAHIRSGVRKVELIRNQCLKK